MTPKQEADIEAAQKRWPEELKRGLALFNAVPPGTSSGVGILLAKVQHSYKLDADGARGMPEKFPDGAVFLYCDFLPTVYLPNGTYWVFDPDPRELPLESATPTMPSIIDEALFRERTERMNEEDRKAHDEASRSSFPPLPQP